MTRWIAMLLTTCAFVLAGSTVYAEPGDADSVDEPKATDRDRPLRGPKADGEKRGPRARMGEDGERKARGPRHHHPGPIFRHLLEGLELSDQQKTEIRDVLKNNGEKMRQYHEANKEKFEGIREQMKQAREDKDREKMKQLYEQMKQFHEGRPVKPEDVVQQIRTKLTPEQRETFDKRVEELKEKMEGAREARKEKMQQRREKMKERKNKKESKPEDKGSGEDLEL